MPNTNERDALPEADAHMDAFGEIAFCDGRCFYTGDLYTPDAMRQQFNAGREFEAERLAALATTAPNAGAPTALQAAMEMLWNDQAPEEKNHYLKVAERSHAAAPTQAGAPLADGFDAATARAERIEEMAGKYASRTESGEVIFPGQNWLMFAADLATEAAPAQQARAPLPLAPSEAVLSIKSSEWRALSPEAQEKLLAITGAGSRNLARAQARAVALDKPLCTVPPEGWACSRAAGHDGPCACTRAQPQALVDRAIVVTYEKLHEGKLGAHWLWCVMEQIAAGVPEVEAMRGYGYYEPRDPASEADALRAEAATLAGILAGMVEGGYSDLATLYTADQPDGDGFVKRAAEVLDLLATRAQPQADAAEPVATQSALLVACPHCSAAVGEPCRWPETRTENRDRPHKARAALVDAAQAPGARGGPND